MSLYIPTYFSPISQYSKIINDKAVTFEIEDNFQKQTYRNRCYIYASNGKQLLNIPIKHDTTTLRKKTKDALVANEYPWQIQHFKSLQVAYRSSPFFEIFEDDLSKIYHKKYQYLLDVNIDTHLFVTDALQICQDFVKTSEYDLNPDDDLRSLAVAKNGEILETNTYKQLFDDKYGFIPNLSILDLLFMEGANAISFLVD